MTEQFFVQIHSGTKQGFGDIIDSQQVVFRHIKLMLIVGFMESLGDLAEGMGCIYDHHLGARAGCLKKRAVS